MRYNSYVLKLKTSWYLRWEINFKLLIKNRLDPAQRAKISKMFGYLFLSTLGPQHNISNLSTLVFLLLQKFEFAFHVWCCCVIRAWSSDFNSSSYLQLWIDCIHQSCTTGKYLGMELIKLSSLCVGDFILRGFITLKICGMPSYWCSMVTNIVHHLKLLRLIRFHARSPTMARVIAIYQKHMTR